MRAALPTTRRARRVTAAALGGVAVLAIVGGSALTAMVANAAGTTYSCQTTTGGTALVDFAGGGTGLVNTGSSGGLVGIGTDANGVQVGLVNCVAVVNVGTSTAGPGASILVGTQPAPTQTQTPAPTVTVTATPTPTSSPTTSTTPAPAPTVTLTAPATTTTLKTVKISSTSKIVYPAAKGYKNSSVTFSIKGLTAVKGSVKITGKAVLRKGTKVVKTWKIGSATSKLHWNGKVGKKVRAGVYVLTVTVRSSDGTKKVSVMKIRVSDKHLVTRTAVVTSVVRASDATSKMPAVVARAFQYGRVTAAVRTVAEVHGPAKLVFSTKGIRRVVPLKDGTHTTDRQAVPKNFTRVMITHDWKKGVAKLISVVTIWHYKRLV